MNAELRALKARKALAIAIVFCMAFMIVEVIFGIRAHSLALLADAMHLLTDVAALSLSLFATVVSRWAGSKRLSFGWHRAEVVGALASVFLVWALVGGILYAAAQRFKTQSDCARQVEGKYTDCEGINAPEMLGVGACGFVVNLTCAAILMWGGHAHSHGGLAGGSGSCAGHSHGASTPSDDDREMMTPLLVGGPTTCHGSCNSDGHDHGHDHHDHDDHDHDHDDHDHHDHDDHGHDHGADDDHYHHTNSSETRNMNVRGAMIHAFGDCVQSLGVVLAAGIIWYGTGEQPNPHSWYNIADPCCSVLFAIVTLYATRYLTVDAFYVLMEGTPDSISYPDLHDAFSAIEGVTAVAHLHVWALTPSIKSLSVHLVCPDEAKHRQTLARATTIARKFGVDHSTVQLNFSEDDESHGATSPACVSYKGRADFVADIMVQ